MRALRRRGDLRALRRRGDWVWWCVAAWTTTVEATAGEKNAKATTPYDLRPFEAVVIPRWLDRFGVDVEAGRFSYLPQPSQPATLYGTVDATHLLASCGRLPSHTATRAAWARTITEYRQAATGWFEDAAHDEPSARQPYHRSASSVAALRLLGASGDDVRAGPPRKVAALVAANNASAWEAVFDPLYYDACPSGKLDGAQNIHSCGQIIGAYAVLAAMLGTEDDDDEITPAFLEWWTRWLARRTDRAIGVLCPTNNGSLLDRVECLGGAMPTHAVELGLGLVDTLPSARALLDFALSVQNDTGGAWTMDADATLLGSLTLDGVFQVTRAAEQLVDTVLSRTAARASCTTVLDMAVPQLNDPEVVLGKYAQTSHDLPNVVAAVAECARAFPELVRTNWTWDCCAVYV